jgi:hypothetical protein
MLLSAAAPDCVINIRRDPATAQLVMTTASPSLGGEVAEPLPHIASVVARVRAAGAGVTVGHNTVVSRASGVGTVAIVGHVRGRVTVGKHRASVTVQ